jgi:hypothetical protein
VLVHLSKNKDGKFSFDPISVNLLTEVAKSLFALGVLLLVVSSPADGSSLGWEGAVSASQEAQEPYLQQQHAGIPPSFCSRPTPPRLIQGCIS